MAGKEETQTKEERTEKQLVGKAAKAARQREEDIKHDEKLYRAHGLG